MCILHYELKPEFAGDLTWAHDSWADYLHVINDFVNDQCAKQLYVHMYI